MVKSILQKTQQVAGINLIKAPSSKKLRRRRRSRVLWVIWAGPRPRRIHKCILHELAKRRTSAPEDVGSLVKWNGTSKDSNDLNHSGGAEIRSSLPNGTHWQCSQEDKTRRQAQRNAGDWLVSYFPLFTLLVCTQWKHIDIGMSAKALCSRFELCYTHGCIILPWLHLIVITFQYKSLTVFTGYSVRWCWSTFYVIMCYY